MYSRSVLSLSGHISYRTIHHTSHITSYHFTPLHVPYRKSYDIPPCRQACSRVVNDRLEGAIELGLVHGYSMLEVRDERLACASTRVGAGCDLEAADEGVGDALVLCTISLIMYHAMSYYSTVCQAIQ